MRNSLSTVRGRIVVSILALAALSLVAGLAVFSAFSSTQASGTNQFTAGTVTLTTDGTGSALFDLSAMKPGDTTSECVQVTYGGTLPASVEMYGTQSGAGSLADYLQTTITRGTFPGSAPGGNDCTGFVPDTSGSSGNGVLFDDVLTNLPGSSNPLADPSTSWTSGDVHVYEITVTLPSSVPDAAQGMSASSTFTWQATNN